MTRSASDITQVVEYSMDKWLIDRVPLALSGCAAGLAIALHAPGKGNGAAVAIVYLALLGLAGVGFALVTKIEQSGISFLWEVPIHIVAYISIAFIIAVAVAALGLPDGNGAGPYYGSLSWSRLVDPPPNVFGWMLIDLGLGWTAFASYRHVYPARPVLMLSPSGISFHTSWLRDLHIPWQDIRGAGPLEPGGSQKANPNVIVVLVGMDFYQRHVAPKRSVFEPPGTEYMFRQKGELMQIALNSSEVAVAPRDYLIPVEARWKAFRDQPRRAPEPSAGPRLIHGLWSAGGTWWQAIQFLAPLVAAAAIIIHAIALK